MAKPRASEKKPEIELAPDAWPRFERLIKDAAKAGPQHREAAKPKRRTKAGARKR
jgi:hypothetical protein